jgi:hypothetical protein
VTDFLIIAGKWRACQQLIAYPRGRLQRKYVAAGCQRRLPCAVSHSKPEIAENWTTADNKWKSRGLIHIARCTEDRVMPNGKKKYELVNGEKKVVTVPPVDSDFE